MNSFDAAVSLGLVVAVVTGFNAGLLRSAVTILAYLIAMPIAISAMSLMSPHIGGNISSPLTQNSLLLFGIFLIVGIVLGKGMRMALDDTFGPGGGIGDRLAVLRSARCVPALSPSRWYWFSIDWCRPTASRHS
jgi:membrane protein required for colicin V production